MNTVEEAKKLWCPMARVAQIGAVETGTAYNRALLKMHRTIKASQGAPDAFELGQDKPEKLLEVTILEMQAEPSSAAGCMADKCACWRWTPKEGERPEVVQEVNGFKRVITKHGPMTPTHGYCGLAGRPEVTV